MCKKLSIRKLITSALVRGQDKQVVWIMPNSKHAVTLLSRVVGSTSYPSLPFLIYISRLYFLLFNNTSILNGCTSGFYRNRKLFQVDWETREHHELGRNNFMTCLCSVIFCFKILPLLVGQKHYIIDKS